MLTLAPVALSFATPASVSLASVENPVQAKLDNESNFALTVQIGQNQHWLPAWTSDVYEVGPGSVLAISPLLLTSAVSTPSSLLLVTVAQQGESFPGSFPAPLVRQASSYAVDSLLGSFAVPAGGSLTGSRTFAVAQDVRALLILYSGPALTTLNSLDVTGTTTGAEYFGRTVDSQLEVCVISPAVDGSYLVKASALNASTVFVAAIRGSQAVLAAITGQPVSVTISSAGGFSSVDVTDRAARLLGTVSPVAGSTFDVSDRAGRLLGTVSPVAGSTFDVSDRAARLLGAVSAAAGSTFDVSDRAARALGAVSAAAGAVFPRGRRRAYDLSAVTLPAAGTQATILLAAPGVGVRYYLDTLISSLTQSTGTAAASATNVAVRDGSSTGTVLWGHVVGSPATAGSQSGPMALTDQALKQPTANAALWIGFGGAQSDVLQGLSVGAHTDA